MDFRTFLLWAIVCLSAMAMTFTGIYVSEDVTEVPQIKEDVTEENYQNETKESFWMNSIDPVSSIVGSVAATLASELIGHKNVLLASNTLMIFGLYEKVEFVTVMGLGAFSTTIPLFVSEAAQPKTSGTLINLLYFTISVTHLLEQAIEIKLDTDVFWPQMSLTLSLIFLILYKAPSPKSLGLGIKHWKKTLKNYFNALKLNHQLRIILLGGVLIHASSQLIGHRFINYQNQKVLQVGVISRSVEFSSTIMLSILGFVIEYYFIQKKGRRFVVLLGLGLVGLSLGVEGTLSYIGGTGSIIKIKWAGFVIFSCVYEPFMGATPWIIVSESQPRCYRGLASGIAAATGYMCSWIAVSYLPIKVDGKWPIYLLYTGITTLSFGLIFLVLPESAQNLRDKVGIFQIKRKRNDRWSFWVGQKKMRVREPIRVWHGGPKELLQLFYKKFGKNYFEVNNVSVG